MCEQGKECANLFLLIGGEVEVVVDVPYTDDRELMESALQIKMQVSGADSHHLLRECASRCKALEHSTGEKEFLYLRTLSSSQKDILSRWHGCIAIASKLIQHALL